MMTALHDDAKHTDRRSDPCFAWRPELDVRRDTLYILTSERLVYVLLGWLADLSRSHSIVLPQKATPCIDSRSQTP